MEAGWRARAKAALAAELGRRRAHAGAAVERGGDRGWNGKMMRLRRASRAR